MAKADDVTVTIRAIDKVTPALRRIRWHLWLYRYGAPVITGLLTVLFVVGCALAFVIGRVSA